MENTSAMAVSAFSPPESRWMLLFFLPGGCATIYARIENLVTGEHQLGLAATKKLGKEAAELAIDGIVGLLQLFPVSRSIRRIASSRVSMACIRSSYCASRYALRCSADLSSSSAAKVDRAEIGNLARESRHLPLQAGF